jgi:hypothetical protein
MKARKLIQISLPFIFLVLVVISLNSLDYIENQGERENNGNQRTLDSHPTPQGIERLQETPASPLQE